MLDLEDKLKERDNSIDGPNIKINLKQKKTRLSVNILSI